MKKNENILTEIVKKRKLDIERKKLLFSQNNLISMGEDIKIINSLEKKIISNKNIS